MERQAKRGDNQLKIHFDGLSMLDAQVANITTYPEHLEAKVSGAVNGAFLAQNLGLSLCGPIVHRPLAPLPGALVCQALMAPS